MRIPGLPVCPFVADYHWLRWGLAVGSDAASFGTTIGWGFSRSPLLDGYVSLNLFAADGSVARQLLDTAFYTKVPPGHYTFHVVASNNDGVWNENGASLGLALAPRLWETRSFRLLSLLLVALIIAGI